MVKRLTGLAVAVLLVGIGWTAGRAQTAAPDFELVVHGAPGDTQIVCRSGCTLAYRRDSGQIDQRSSKKDVGFACGNESANRPRCEVFFAGFVQR